MRMLNHRRALGLLAALAFVVVAPGCAPSDPSAPEITRSAVPTSRVVAVGNSLTAGFTNGGLVIDGQLASFANLVSRRVNGNDMTMPLVASPGIGSTGQGTLAVTAAGGFEFQEIPGGNPLGLLLASGLLSPYDNLGVPAATTQDITTATSSANSQSPGNLFFDAILRNSAFPGSRTQLEQMQSLVTNGVPATEVLILWVGNNDVLGGTLSGNPVVGTNVTPAAAYQALMQPVVDAAVALDVPQVVLLNIPPVTAIPYVTTIAGLLQQGSLPLAAIRTEESDVQAILLSAQTTFLNPDFTPKAEYIIGSGSAEELTLGGEFTLTSAEIAAVTAETAAYNSYLAGVATANGWALVDVATILGSLSVDPTVRPNATFPLVPAPGGGFAQNVNTGFSLDAIHLSEVGNARVANAVLAALNDEYDEDYASYDLADFENLVGWEQFGTGSKVEFNGVHERLAKSPLFQR